MMWNVQIPKPYDRIETPKEVPMTIFEDRIRHDGGTHSVEVELDGSDAVIRFGASFTLRVDEGNLMKLRALLDQAGNEMARERRDVAGARELSESQLHDVFELEETEIAEAGFAPSAEDDMIQRGIDAREMMKGTASAGDWNPNDPSNW